MNKTVRKIISALFAVIMLAAFIYLGIRDYSGDIHGGDKARMARHFESLDGTNVFEILTYGELGHFLNSGTGILVFCVKESPWCNRYLGYVNEVAKENNIEKVYYYDISRDRDSNTSLYRKVIEKTQEHLQRNDKGNHFKLTPDLYVFKNGEIIGRNNYTAGMVGNITPEEYWTNLKIRNFKEELNDLFSKLTS